MSKQTMFRAHQVFMDNKFTVSKSLSSNSLFDGTHQKFILLGTSTLLANDTRN
jgi:hypothetical protein